MSRYIDYDALDYKNWHMIGKSSDFIDGVVYMVERIEEAPSIDIVRCKECALTNDDAYYCEYHEHNVMPDDFCSYGERKTDEQR